MRRYTDRHDWIEFAGSGHAHVGLTSHGREVLGEVTFIQRPKPGTHLKAGDVAVVVESTKAAIDIAAPLSGEVVEGEGGEGYLYSIALANPQELDQLLEEETY